jgi:hypothetical protein
VRGEFLEECVDVFGWAHCDFSSRLQSE